MASPDVAAAPVNGVAAASRPDSPASVNSSTKRKRDATDDGDRDAGINGGERPKPIINGIHKTRDEKPMIRQFFDVLQSLDPFTSGILKRPLPDAFADTEPSAKRAKSEEDGKSVSIASKVTEQAYDNLEALFRDLDQATKAQIKELESSTSENVPDENDEAIAKITAFKAKAFDLWRREAAYPSLPKLPVKSGFREPNTSRVVLTAIGPAPTPRPLFTSLQRSTANGIVKPIAEDALPNGVSITQILPDTTPSTDKGARVPTLGELFPSPRNLPPLQPPKAPKNTTKGNVLKFYHPELTEKSKYRTGTYFSQNLTAGQWLDYSNATPTTHAKTKQRERAQSLAGHKPSPEELEMLEMEALFRGAFSSFAPCKDDSAAMISSRQMGRVWWSRVGQRSFNKLVESETSPEDEIAEEAAPRPEAVDFDEERVQEMIDNWDDTLVDPSLDQVIGKKAGEDKDTEDVLAEISDMIETLLSQQRIRNLAMPTSQDRLSADPVNGDMLRNGALTHQPSEEEMLTYQALKAQLTLVIGSLPPFAVARLNSDKLEELAISTRIEVRTDEYKGVMEEDEPARLARQAAQAAVTANQRQHRVASVGSPSPYPPQYPNQYTPGARPIGNAQHFPQTPGRPQVAAMYQQRPPATGPVPQAHYNQRAQPPPQYRAQGHAFAPQLAKSQTPYGHSNMPQYTATPQARMPQHPGYGMSPAASPGHRYPQGYQPGFQQPHQQVHPQHMPHAVHQQQQHHQQHPSQQSPLPPQAQHSPVHPQMAQHAPQHQQHAQHPQHPQHPQQAAFAPYANGQQQMARTMSPQVPQAHPYSHTPTPPQQHSQLPRPPYGSPGMPPNAAQRPYGGAPQANMMVPGRASSLSGFATVMPDAQHRQLMEQARVRADAEQRVSGHISKVAAGEGAGVVGLAGIGLGGTFDVNKMAAKMQMGAASMSPSPRVMHGGPSPVNGGAVPVPSPSPASLPQHGAMGGPPGASLHHGAPSPALGQGFKPPAQQA